MREEVLCEVQVRSQWRKYIALLRLHYHCSFVGVLLGVLVVTRQWPPPLVWRTFLLYLSLNVLLYGGLYSLNAITDADSDSRRRFKDCRPVASGAISRKAAGVFAAGLIVAGFVTGSEWLGFEVMPVYLLLVALNVSYSLFFRNLFVFDVLFNSATHPPRFWLGMWLADGSLSWDWFALVFLFAVGMSASRRSVLLNNGSWESRGPLARYSTVNLLVIKGAALCGIVLLWVLNPSSFQIPYIVTGCAYIIVVGGIEVVPRFRSAFEMLWLR